EGLPRNRRRGSRIDAVEIDRLLAEFRRVAQPVEDVILIEGLEEDIVRVDVRRAQLVNHRLRILLLSAEYAPDTVRMDREFQLRRVLDAVVLVECDALCERHQRAAAGIQLCAPARRSGAEALQRRPPPAACAPMPAPR